MAEKKVKVKIKPLHGIGGIGEAGDVVWMSKTDAEIYIRDGYVEYVEDDSAPVVASEQAQLFVEPKEEAEDHTIMKPQARPAKSKGKRK